MDANTSLSFCYSRAAGLLRKSFVQDRVQLLFAAKSLEELWSLLFKDSCPLVPQALLANQIEEKAFEQLVNSYTQLLDQFDNPSEILKSQIEYFENENLKLIVDAISQGERKCPKLIDLGGYSQIHPEFYPDIQKITKGSQYAFLSSVPSEMEIQHTEVLMDKELIKDLWNEIQSLSGDEKQICQKFFIEEYSIKNIIWAMRLSVYYKKNREEIIQQLFYVTDSPSALDPIAAPALKILDYDIHDYSAWQKFSYASELNPYDGGDWLLDPAWFEQRHDANRIKKYINYFHQYPMTEISLVSWFKIKIYELNCIRSAVEGLRLNINSNDAMKALGVIIE